MTDFAAWVAANMVLDAVAPLANAARDAIARATPDQRPYAQRLATCLDAERDRLAPPQPAQAQQAPSPAQGRHSAPQRHQHQPRPQHARPVQEGML